MTDAQDTPAEDQHAASRSMAAAEANRLGFMRINHRFALHVEMLDGLPERECYAVLIKSGRDRKFGRFKPGNPATFASDKTSIEDRCSRREESLRKPRLVDPKKAWVWPVRAVEEKF